MTEQPGASLEERIARLEAIQEITAVVARYGPAVDSGSAQATAQLWEESGTYSFGVAGAGFEHLVGRTGIEEMVNGPGHQEIISHGAAHLMGPPLVEVHGDTAVATGYSLLVRYDAASSRHYVDRACANRWQLRRTDGTWRVTARVNQLLDGRDEARLLLGLALAPPGPTG
ncbi:nuclear transport factor 2 family protein [Nocardioides sp. R1-1]|uniref:nuclear transport factor 2 family protein n=1 Tax=Nocardioides sp. R1-1 TaxID=3383502 RepID=UPI0038CFEE32